MRNPVFILASIALLVSCNKVVPPENVTPAKKYVFPTLFIKTVNNAPIESKTDYVAATFSVEDSDGLTENLSGQIRGRGNSSWWNCPKKSYRIHLDEKYKFLGRHSDAGWCILANFFDKTMLKNDLVYWIGREYCCFDFTPELDFINVYLNDDFIGLYTLVDHLETGKHRVQADYLVEVDSRASAEAGDVIFHTGGIGNSFVIKDPDGVVKGDDAYNVVDGFFDKATDVLYSDEVWLDPVKGYKAYFDMDTLVDWYLINEITKNNDACFHTSSFMNYTVGGKIKMGPLWDYDGCFGNTGFNNNWSYEGLWMADKGWYARLFQDPVFVHMVHKRFLEFYNVRQEWYDRIEARAKEINKYVLKDSSRWNDHLRDKDVWNVPVYRETYWEYIDEFKEWTENRFQWMKSNWEL